MLEGEILVFCRTFIYLDSTNIGYLEHLVQVLYLVTLLSYLNSDAEDKLFLETVSVSKY